MNIIESINDIHDLNLLDLKHILENVAKTPEVSVKLHTDDQGECWVLAFTGEYDEQKANEILNS